MTDGLPNMDMSKIVGLLSDPNIQKALSQFSGFTGQIYPKPKNIYSHTPAYHKEIEVGKDQKKGVFSTVKIWLHEPTFEFPKHGIFFSVNNKTSAYFKFNGVDEMNVFLSWLRECISEIENIVPLMIEKENVVEKAKMEYDMKTKDND